MKAIHRKLLLLPDDEEDVKQSTTVLSANLPRYFLIPPSTTTTTTTTTTNNDTGTNTTVRKHVTPISSFDSSLALAVVVLLTALFLMGFFSVYLRRLSEESPVEISRRRRRNRLGGGGLLTGPKFGGVDPIIIQSLPLFSYENEKEPLDCAVCLTEFEEKESVKMVPNCGHVFHPECIDKWLASHASCPLCRSTQLLLVQEKKRESNATSGTSRDASEPTMTVANPLRVVERERGVCLTSSWSRSLSRKSSWPSLLVVDKQEVIRKGGVLLRRSLSM